MKKETMCVMCASVMDCNEGIFCTKCANALVNITHNNKAMMSIDGHIIYIDIPKVAP